MSGRTLAFGVFADPLHKQLKVKLTPELAHLQKDADALARLAVRGILPDSQIHQARKKIVRRIMACSPGCPAGDASTEAE